MRVLAPLRLRRAALVLRPLRRADQLRLNLIDRGRNLLRAPTLEAAFDETVLDLRAAAPHVERHTVRVEVRLVKPERDADETFSARRKLAAHDAHDISAELVFDLQ